MKKITIKFIENYSPYLKGESATFFEREANRLIDRGFAIYASGDAERETAADRLKALHETESKNIPGPAMTRHIPGPENTKGQNASGSEEKKGNDTKGHSGPNSASKVEGAGKTARKCGKCGKPGHVKTNCPQK